LSIVYAFFLYRLKQKFDETKNKAGINSQRYNLERNIYLNESKLLEDSYNFIDTNKLLILYASDNSSQQDIPNYSFFKDLGIDFSKLVISDEKAVCLMPFNKDFHPLYIVIKRACSDNNVLCTRSDDFYEPGNLLKQIIISIIKSKYVFAVLDGRNPNVFYEIGLAHAIGKPVFLIAHYNQKYKLPFDIKSSRLLLYKSYKHLESLIHDVISKPNDSDGNK
jgi:hypothetical protein